VESSILLGDAATVLATLPDESVQCCVTSPPFWGLRDYGVEGQIGKEAFFTEYADRLVAVFRQVRRVLRNDGVLWLNLGDRYMSWNAIQSGARRHTGVKDKDLIGLPWMVAFALRADGWWLRADVIWSKPAPVPESVKDRPTVSHEYVFLLSKSKRYRYDAEAIAEAASPRINSNRRTHKYPGRARAKQNNMDRFEIGETRNARSVWSIAYDRSDNEHAAAFPVELARRCIVAGSRAGDVVLDPFAGTGTTCAVASVHLRRYVGIELNPKYVEIAKARVASQGAPLFVPPPRDLFEDAATDLQ